MKGNEGKQRKGVSFEMKVNSEFGWRRRDENVKELKIDGDD